MCVSDIPSALEVRVGTGTDESMLDTANAAAVTKIYGSVKTTLKENLNPTQRKFEI